MPNRISPNKAERPAVHQRARCIAAAAILCGALACAGHHHISQAPPHPIAIQVNNNLTVPTELTIYIAPDQGGTRQMLGTVPGAQTKTFSYTPAGWGQPYRFVAERQLAGPIRSPRFTVADPATGTITWAIVPNQVQFFDSGNSPSP